MHIYLDIPDPIVAGRVLQTLEQFKKDDVIIKQSDEEHKSIPVSTLSDEYVKAHWRELLLNTHSDPHYHKSEDYQSDRAEYLMEKYK